MIHTLKKKLKHLYLKLLGKYHHLAKQIHCKAVWYGNAYGGFYVCPDVLTHEAVVYSFGIGKDVSFDLAVIKHHNCLVFGFDPTPKSIQWIQQQTIPTNFSFFEYGISHISGNVDFYLPKEDKYVSGSFITQTYIDENKKITVPMKNLADIIQQLGHTRIDVLKMDIEGAEYEVLDNILQTPIEIRQILIEFHDRFFPNGKTKTQEAIQKLTAKGYKIFAVSDSYEEVSFIKI